MLYDLFKSILITVEVIRSSSEHSVFLCKYITYKTIFEVETDDILVATQNIICFEILTKYFDTLFY